MSTAARPSAELPRGATALPQPLPPALPHDDPKQRQPDIAKARELLGWNPTVPLPEGLKRTIAYFDRLLSGAREPPAEEAIVAD